MSLPKVTDDRFNPFDGTETPTSIVDETHQIPSASPYRIQLVEVPTSLGLTVTSDTASPYTEVSVAPASQFQYRVDWTYKTGIVEFHSDAAGDTVEIDYDGLGTVMLAGHVNRLAERNPLENIIGEAWQYNQFFDHFLNSGREFPVVNDSPPTHSKTNTFAIPRSDLWTWDSASRRPVVHPRHHALWAHLHSYSSDTTMVVRGNYYHGGDYPCVLETRFAVYPLLLAGEHCGAGLALGGSDTEAGRFDYVGHSVGSDGLYFVTSAATLTLPFTPYIFQTFKAVQTAASNLDVYRDNVLVGTLSASFDTGAHPFIFYQYPGGFAPVASGREGLFVDYFSFTVLTSGPVT